MIINILGTAQDGGCPQAGCGCESCLRALNNNQYVRLPAALGITSTDNKRFLLDATPALPQQLYNWQQSIDNDSYLPDATLITHAHIGHYTGLMHLGKEVLNANLHPVYVTSAMAQFFVKHAPWRDLIINKNIELRELNYNHQQKLSDSMSVTAIPVPHRNEYADTVGFLMEDNKKRAFFLPDIDTWDGFVDRLNEVLAISDIAFLDATFYSHDELSALRSRDLSKVPHPTVEHTLQMIKNGKIKPGKCQIHLIHFNHTNRLCNGDISSFINHQDSVSIAVENEVVVL